MERQQFRDNDMMDIDDDLFVGIEDDNDDDVLPVAVPVDERLRMERRVRDDFRRDRFWRIRRLRRHHGNINLNNNEEENGPILVQVAASDNPLLYDLIREGLPCSSDLASARGCNLIVECCRTNPEAVYYTCPRMLRTPLHEAALRCSCMHVIEAILQVDENITMSSDIWNSTPLHLLFSGISTHNVNTPDLQRIIDALLSPNPSHIAGMPNLDGDLPLHCACIPNESMVPLVCLERLLEVRPDSAGCRNAHLQTPLHLHCRRRNASVAVAELLVHETQNFKCRCDDQGMTELHYAARMCNNDLVQYLVNQADPTAARVRSHRAERTALHILCSQHPDTDLFPAIQSLLRMEPDTACFRDSPTLYTPLHLLFTGVRSSRNISLPIVEFIVRTEPAALRSVDHERFLPLHHACQVGADPAVIRLLLDAYPDAAGVLTRKKDSALSLACATNVCAETVSLLLNANSSMTERCNDYGFLPIHCACRAHRPKLAIVESLLEANPTSVHRLTHAGESPVHLASGASKSVLDLLTSTASTIINANKTKVATKQDDMNYLGNSMLNKIGNTPLHNACFHSASIESIEALAESNPKWIVIKNHAGFSPIQILCKNGRINGRIVTVFSRLCGSETFSSVDLVGNTPLHSAMREETDLEALRALIRAFPDALHLRTEYEDTPLHLACLRKVRPDVVHEVAQASSACIESAWTGRSGSNVSPLVLRNRAGQTPIGLAIDDFQSIFRHCSPGNCLVKASYSSEQTRSFEVLAALVKILHYGPGNNYGRKQPLVTACISLHRKEVRLDPAFIRRAIFLYPEEAKVRDENGNYPLHLEASIPVEKMFLLNGGTSVCCNGSCHERSGVLQMLMEIFPDAASTPNKQGDYPLGLMIQNGRHWDNTFGYILRAHPEALHWVDNMTPSFSPRVLSRVGNDCGAGTLFTFIRARPAILLEK